MSDEEEEKENRIIILPALKTLREKLDAAQSLPNDDVYPAVKDALDGFRKAHEDDTMASPIYEDIEPWTDYTGVRFGIGDDVDRRIDMLQAYGINRLKEAKAPAQRDRVLGIVTGLISKIEAADDRGPGEESGDPGLPGGRRKRASKKKTKKVTKKKAKKSRMTTQRRKM